MRTRLRTTLYVALPLVAGLWLAPVTFAHDEERGQPQPYSSRSYSNPYPSSGDAYDRRCSSSSGSCSSGIKGGCPLGE